MSPSPRTPRLLVSCGEPSGDLYAAELVRHIRIETPDLAVFGLGGDRLREQNADLVAHVRDLAVVGLLEVLRHLPRIREVFRRVLEEVDRDPPRAAVLVDYPDFNLRLARELRRRGIPVVYYVSPQVWAWRRGRIRAIRDTVTRMLVIFPFEEALYREAGVPVSFVGHPLVDLVRPPADRAGFLRGHGLDPARPVVALLPGSRPREVAHNLPPLAGAVRLLAERRPDLQFVLAVAPSLEMALFEEPLAGLNVRTLAGATHAAVGIADLALVASGTATVETALLGTPMVVVYRLSPLTYALGRPLVRVPHYAMVNLIAERRVVPELIQQDFTAERVAQEAQALLEDAGRAARMRADLEEVRRRLGAPGASARAAAAVRDILEAQDMSPQKLQNFID
ncbi:MAG: lipid-A-disaccharide synthase [Acidobacteria bacterium]|nr:lipid-A-disaccharide synthase [Acidobacteriota bacterium]